MTLTTIQLKQVRLDAQLQLQQRRGITGHTLRHTIQAGRIRCTLFAPANDARTMPALLTIREAVTLVSQSGFMLPPLVFYVGGDGAGNAFLSGAEPAAVAHVDLGAWQAGAPGDSRQHSAGTSAVLHALGHLLHEKGEASLYWENKTGKAIKPRSDVWLEAAVRVGLRTAAGERTCLTFVAACFTGLLTGKRYDRVVRNAYIDCGGPQSPALMKGFAS